MTIDFVSLIFIWLLPLTASHAVTSGQNHNFTNMTTGEVETHDQLTTQETTKPSTKPSLQTTRTMPSKTFLSNIQTAATFKPSELNNSTAGMKSMTEVQFKVTTSALVVTSQASNPTTTTRVPSMLSSSTQSQEPGKTSTSQLTSDKISHPSTHRTQSTNLISTITTSTKSVENKSTSTSPVTGGDATQSTGLYITSMAMTKTPFIHITEAKEKSKKGTNHSKAVAGLIGGALVLMMVGFLVIYIKKRKLQRQQITTRDWAGPSPYLEGGALRSSNRISLSSFLPQRLSKRLSLLPETDEELEDMTPGTTFGDKHQGSTSGPEVDGTYVEESNETAVVVPETVENSVSVQTNDPLSTNNKSEFANLSQDHPANPPILSGTVENALAQMNDGLGQP